MTNAINTLSQKCIKGIKPNLPKIKQNLERNPVVVTALTPHIGYQKAAEIVKEAYSKNKTVRGILLGEGFKKEEIDKILNLKKLVKP